LVLLSAGNSGKVLSSGSLDISGLHGHHGTVGVSNKTGVGVGKSVVADWVDNTSGGGMGDLGSVDLSGVSGDDSSVGVSDESSGHSDSVRVGSGVGVASIDQRVDKSASSSVGQLGSSHLGSVDWDLSSVGVGHKLGRADSNSSGENLQIIRYCGSCLWDGPGFAT